MKALILFLAGAISFSAAQARTLYADIGSCAGLQSPETFFKIMMNDEPGDFTKPVSGFLATDTPAFRCIGNSGL